MIITIRSNGTISFECTRIPGGQKEKREREREGDRRSKRESSRMVPVRKFLITRVFGVCSLLEVTSRMI